MSEAMLVQIRDKLDLVDVKLDMLISALAGEGDDDDDEPGLAFDGTPNGAARAEGQSLG